MNKNLKINIASPAYGSNYSYEYVRSVFDIIGDKHKNNIEFVFSHIDWSDIILSRNYLVSNFYFKENECTHLLFLDADMGFEKELIYEMLNLKKDVVGTIYPKRQINLKKFYNLSRKYEYERAYAKSCEFVGQRKLRLRARNPVLRDFEEVDRCGTGIMLISRECIKQMIEKVPDILKEGEWAKIWLGNNFDKYITPFDKIRVNEAEYSEDFSFCYKWRKYCDGKIYVSKSRKVEHVGRLVVKTRVADL